MANKCTYKRDGARYIGQEDSVVENGLLVVITVIIAIGVISFVIGLGSEISQRKEYKNVAANEMIVSNIQFIKDNGGTEDISKAKLIVEKARENGFFTYKDHSDILSIYEKSKLDLERKKIDNHVNRAFAILEKE